MITLNLISPDQKELLKKKHFYLFLRNIISFVLIFLIIIAIVLILTNQFLSIAAEGSLNNEKNPITGVKNIRELNAKLKNIITIQNQYTDWSGALQTITQTIPAGIELSSLEIDKNTKILKISGQAKTRNDYLNLITALGNNPHFADIVSPLENLLSKENINFNLSLTYRFNEETK